jgi:hypothetical protein
MFFPDLVANINPIYDIVDKVTRSLTGLAASIDNVAGSIIRLEVTLSQFRISLTVERTANGVCRRRKTDGRKQSGRKRNCTNAKRTTE